VTTPGFGECIRGAILDEAIRQKKKDGTPFVKVITDAGIIPGIKIDTGAKDRVGYPKIVVYSARVESRETFAKQTGATAASSLEDFVSKLVPPRTAWLMIPAAAVDQTLSDLVPLMQKGDDDSSFPLKRWGRAALFKSAVEATHTRYQALARFFE